MKSVTDKQTDLRRCVIGAWRDRVDGYVQSLSRRSLIAAVTYYTSLFRHNI